MVPKRKYCATHNQESQWYNGVNCGQFGCWASIKGRHFDHTVATASQTWFERSYVSKQQRLILAYCFAYGFGYKDTLRKASVFESTVSSETISDPFSLTQEVFMASVDSNHEEQGKIGGPRVRVEIDEGKIGKRKYIRGWIVESTWIIGMIKRGEHGYRI